MIFLTKCWDHNSSSLNHHQIIRHLLGQYSSSLNHHQIIRHLFGHYSSSFNHHQIIATVLGHSFVCSRSLSCFIWYVSRNIIRLLHILGLNAVWCAGIHHYQAIPATRSPFCLPHAPDGPQIQTPVLKVPGLFVISIMCYRCEGGLKYINCGVVSNFEKNNQQSSLIRYQVITIIKFPIRSHCTPQIAL